MVFQAIMFPRVFWLCMILLIGSGLAADVPFVFEASTSEVAGYSSYQIEQASTASFDLAGVPSVFSPLDDDVLEFPITGGGSTPGSTTEKNAGELKKALDARVEPDNSRVRDEAVVLALKYPGEKTIEQIVSIYSYLKNGDGPKKGWGYVSDPRGIDYFMFANQTLKNGDRANCVGGGDCDDFAILMSALIESIGGTTRIVLACNSSIGGHAYAEVYLGNLSDQNSQIDEIINWLKQEFNTDKIYSHVDTDTRDVWLNLDWGPDEQGNAHPGGPFFQGDKHIVLCIRDKFGKTPLKPPEKANEPPRLISLTPDRPSPQDAGTSITWTVEAKDPENDQVLYRLLLNGKPQGDWTVRNTWTWGVTKAEVGDNEIEVWVRDGKHSDKEGFDDHKLLSFVVTASNRNLAIGQTDSIDPSKWTENGNSLFKAGSYEDALKCYEKAIQHSPLYADAWYGKANALCMQGMYEECIACLDKCTNIDPTNLAALNNKGAALFELGRYDEALACYDRSIKEDPYFATPWSNKAEALLKLGKYSEALDCSDRSLSIDSSNAFAWMVKGKATSALEKNVDALGCFDKAIELDPEDAEAWNSKAIVLEKLDRMAEANTAYAKAKELGYKA